MESYAAVVAESSAASTASRAPRGVQVVLLSSATAEAGCFVHLCPGVFSIAWPNLPPTYLAACYERLGKTPEAKSEVAKAVKLMPNLSARVVALTEPYARPDDLEHLLEPLRKAGLPE